METFRRDLSSNAYDERNVKQVEISGLKFFKVSAIGNLLISIWPHGISCVEFAPISRS